MPVILKGPLFTFIPEVALTLFVREAEVHLAKVVLERIHQRLGQVLVHPTGYYDSQIVINPGMVTTTVTDGGVIYGPWLEGIGSRNATTRFKGYATFRKVADSVRGEVTAIVRSEADKLIGELNG